MIMEYAALGNFQNFLRARRNSPRRSSNSKSSSYFNDPSTYSNEAVKSPTESQPSAEMCVSNLLRPKDYCSFAQQIANGMGFLSSQNVRNSRR